MKVHKQIYTESEGEREMEGDCSGRTSVSLNRRHLEKAH